MIPTLIIVSLIAGAAFILGMWVESIHSAKRINELSRIVLEYRLGVRR
jgi:hypothetical protein